HPLAGGARADSVTRIEPDDAGVGDGRPRLALPRYYFVWNELGHHRVPFHRETGRADHRPLRMPVPQVAHLAHVGHEVREVVGILPEFEDAFDWRVDVDRLVKIYCAPPSAYSEDAPHFEVRGASHHQCESERSGGAAERVSATQTQAHQRAAGQGSQEPGRGRPVALHQLEARAASRPPAL